MNRIYSYFTRSNKMLPSKVGVVFTGITFLLAIVAGTPFSLSLDESKSSEDCPPYFQGNTSVPCWFLGNKCYCFSSFRLTTWMRSDEFCRGGNMTLLSLETEEEDKMINSHVQANPELNFSEFWTSGRYSQEGNNRWEWASLEPFQPFNYTNWHPVYNQPDDNEPGSCALLYFLDYTGYWADNVCIYSTRLICESIE